MAFHQPHRLAYVLFGALLATMVTPAATHATTATAWKNNTYGQTNLPPDLTNVVALSASMNAALKNDGSLLSWATNTWPVQKPAHMSNLTSIAGNEVHSLALKADGTIFAWGYNYNGQCDIPVGLSNVAGISVGLNHSLVLKADGTVRAWGINERDGKPCEAPAGLSNVVAIASGASHSLALRTDGTVAAWSYDEWEDDGAAVVPPGLSNVVSIAAGTSHSLALKSDGTVTAWGYNEYGQTNVPYGLSNVVAVAGGMRFSLALKADGTLVGWGKNWESPTNFGYFSAPDSLTNVAAISAGEECAWALVGNGLPILSSVPTFRHALVNAPVLLNVPVAGAQPLAYQWQHNGTNIPGATEPALFMNHLQLGQAGNYQVIVSNSFGMATSQVQTLTITAPPQHIVLGASQPDGSFTWSVPVPYAPMGIQISTNLVDWQTTTVVTNATDVLRFTDSTTNAPLRFYRVILMP